MVDESEYKDTDSGGGGDGGGGDGGGGDGTCVGSFDTCVDCCADTGVLSAINLSISVSYLCNSSIFKSNNCLNLSELKL